MAYQKSGSAARAPQKKHEQTMQTWNKITGTMRIYCKEFQARNGGSFYKSSVTVSTKDADGEYRNVYIPVLFRGQDVPRPGREGVYTLEISNAFMSIDTYQDRNGQEINQLVLVVTEAEIVGEPD